VDQASTRYHPRYHPGDAGSFFGSSTISGCRPGLQEEVMVITEAMGHSIDDLDPVVDAFHQIGSNGQRL